MTQPSNTATTPQPKLGEPFCNNCGHQLTGLVDSSKCPECGRPIVEVLTRRSVRGRRYRSETLLFGLPLVEIAYGPTDTQRSGHAKAIIALGDKATGFVAIGGTSLGIVALGGRAIGLFSCGGISIGLISAWGGVAIGALANGGLALGLLAFGGAALGIVACGGICGGVYAMGGAPIAMYQIGAGGTAQEAVDVFSKLTWYFGPVGFSLRNFIQPYAVVFGLQGIAAMIIALLAVVTHARKSRFGSSS